MAKGSAGIKEKTDIRIIHPNMYKVVMHNDDFTTMEFVVRILVEVFRKTHPEAGKLMMSVHKNGSAVVGLYSYDIALTKVKKATAMARSEEFPFKMTVEPEDDVLPF